ncbi:MAG: hypothetical protein ACOCRK_10575 [bacterium]
MNFFNFSKPKDSDSIKFRKKWLKKGIELVDITPHCEFRLGISGWCNNFNEPEEQVYHIKCLYRKDIIANFSGINVSIIDDKKYLFYYDKETEDFIIFMKVKI